MGKLEEDKDEAVRPFVDFVDVVTLLSVLNDPHFSYLLQFVIVILPDALIRIHIGIVHCLYK